MSQTKDAPKNFGETSGKKQGYASGYAPSYTKHPLGRPGLYFGLAPLLLSVLLLPAAAFAITEAQFIEKVLARDKLLEEAQIGLDIKQIELDASRDGYVNWNVAFSMAAGYEYTEDKQEHRRRSDNFLSTSPYTRTSKEMPREVGLDFTKRFLWNPGNFKFGVSRRSDSIRNTRYDRDYSNSATTGCDSPKPSSRNVCEDKQTFEDQQNYGGYATEYYAQIDYPLLKHDGNAESLKTYHRNIIDLQDQQLSFYETKEDFLNDRLDDYLSWVLAERQVRINQALLEALRALRPQEDADRAYLQSIILQTENARRDAEIQSQSIKERLSVLLGDATILHETPEFDLRKRTVLVTGSLRAHLKKHSRALQRIALDMKLNQLEIAHHENRLLPALDFTLRAEKEYDNAGTATQSYDDDTTDYQARLEFTYPLGGSITTRAELAKRTLSTRRLEITYAERMERIEGDLQRLASLLDLDETLLLNAIAAAEQSTRLQQQKYAQARESIRDLVEAHRDERAARLDHIDALVEYQTDRIEYDNLLDRIIAAP